MKLALMTWRDVEHYLERSRAVLIPIGSTEQHGPNGILGTDYLNAEAVAERVGEALSVAVAPTISVGMALHHMAFPGSMSLRPETLMAVLRDYVSSLYKHGFRQFLFVNGHGGNVATARVAFSAIREELADAELLWANWYDRPEVSRLARELFGDREGQHATPSEISLTMALYPEHVEVIAGPLETESCRPRGIPGSSAFRAWYPDGRMGSDPSLASRDKGERILAAAVAALVDEAQAVIARGGAGANRR
jgi:creatinine amidohydrolase